MSRVRFMASLSVIGYMLLATGNCQAQLGWYTPTATFTTGSFQVTSTATTPVISGTINGYTGRVTFGVKAAGPFGAVAVEGYKDVQYGANPAGGLNVWTAYGGISPTSGAWTLSPVVPNMGGTAYWPSHGSAWTRYGTTYATLSNCTVLP